VPCRLETVCVFATVEAAAVKAVPAYSVSDCPAPCATLLTIASAESDADGLKDCEMAAVDGAVLLPPLGVVAGVTTGSTACGMSGISAAAGSTDGAGL
jgi:hypothetical protein